MINTAARIASEDRSAKGRIRRGGQFIAQLRSGRARGDEVRVFVKAQFAVKLVAKQEQIEAGLKNLRADREIPNIFDVEADAIRQDERRQRKNYQSTGRAEQRRQRVAKSLKHTGAGENNSRRHEIERDDAKIIAAERDHFVVMREKAHQSLRT